MKIVAIILFILQALSIFGSITNGNITDLFENLFFFNGISGFAEFIGFMLPTIIGCILLGRHEKKMQKKNSVSSQQLANDASAEKWFCSKCGAANMMGVQTCQSCGVSKQWSDANR